MGYTAFFHKAAQVSVRGESQFTFTESRPTFMNATVRKEKVGKYEKN